MSNIPCKNCIVLPICRSKVEKEMDRFNTTYHWEVSEKGRWETSIIHMINKCSCNLIQEYMLGVYDYSEAILSLTPFKE